MGGVWLVPLCKTSKGEAWSCAASLGSSPSSSPWKKLRLTRDWKLGISLKRIVSALCALGSPSPLAGGRHEVHSPHLEPSEMASRVLCGKQDVCSLEGWRGCVWLSPGNLVARGYHGAAPARCRAGRGGPMVGRCRPMTEDNGGCLQGLHTNPVEASRTEHLPRFFPQRNPWRGEGT